MEGFNLCGMFAFVLPIILVIIMGAIATISAILDCVNKILNK